MIVFAKNLFNGLAFGVTQIVPGVSGGTVAIIMGYYNELIDSINNFRKDCKKSLKFLLPFLIGILLGMVLFSSVVTYMLDNFSLPTMLFFVGLIAGIAPAVYGKIKEPGKLPEFKYIMLAVIPIVLLVAVSHLTNPAEPDPREVIDGINIGYMLFLVVVGAVAAAALIVPGVSGSFMLLLFGVYHVATYSLSSIRELLGDITNTEIFFNILKIMAPLGVGIVIGGLLMARIVGILLESYTKIVYSIILGLIIGSVYALLREDMVYESGTAVPMVVAAVAAFIAGWVLSFILGQKKM